MDQTFDINVIWLSVLIGVGTGVLANLATYLFVNVWLPRYRDYVYQSLRVAGSWVIWQSEAPVDGEALSTVWALTATLDQKAYVLHGHATANRVEGGTAVDVINYNVTGFIYDRFVCLIFKNTDKEKIAYSTFLLEAKGDGSKMTGYRSFYGLYKGVVRSVECTWHRGAKKKANCAPHANTEAA